MSKKKSTFTPDGSYRYSKSTDEPVQFAEFHEAIILTREQEDAERLAFQGASSTFAIRKLNATSGWFDQIRGAESKYETQGDFKRRMRAELISSGADLAYVDDMYTIGQFVPTERLSNGTLERCTEEGYNWYAKFKGGFGGAMLKAQNGIFDTESGKRAKYIGCDIEGNPNNILEGFINEAILRKVITAQKESNPGIDWSWVDDLAAADTAGESKSSAFTRAFWDWFPSTSLPLAITEGVKKANALLSLGIPALSIAGVNNTCRKQSETVPCVKGKTRVVEVRYLDPRIAKYATPNRQVTIYFDQDTKPVTVANVTAALEMLVLLIKEHEESVSVKVAVWSGVLGKGIDDAIGAGNWLKVKALTLQEWRLIRGFVNGTVEQNTNWFKAENSMAQFVGVKSPMGTGKTQYVSQWISPRDKDYTLVLTDRISLYGAIAARTGLGRITDDVVNPKGVCLCIDSVQRVDLDAIKAKLLETGGSLNIVLDEANSLVTHTLSGGTAIKTGRNNKIQWFSQLMAYSGLSGGRVFVIDAHLKPQTFEFFHFVAERAAGQEFLKEVNVNHYLNPNKKLLDTYCGKSPKQMLEDLKPLIVSARPDRKLMIFADSAKLDSKFSVPALERYCKSLGQSNVGRIDSYTTRERNHFAFDASRNIDAAIADLAVVVVSPVIESGVSIERTDVADVVVLGFGSSGAEGIAQMTGRVRSRTAHLYLWVAPVVPHDKCFDPDVIRANRAKNYSVDKKICVDRSNMSKARKNSLFGDLIVQSTRSPWLDNFVEEQTAIFQAIENRERSDLFGSVMRLIEDDYIVNMVEPPSTPEHFARLETLDAWFEGDRIERVAEEAKEIFEAKVITPQEAKAIRAAGAYSREQYLSAEKEKYNEKFGDALEEEIAKDLMGWGREIERDYVGGIGQQFTATQASAQLAEVSDGSVNIFDAEQILRPTLGAYVVEVSGIRALLGEDLGKPGVAAGRMAPIFLGQCRDDVSGAIIEKVKGIPQAAMESLLPNWDNAWLYDPKKYLFIIKNLVKLTGHRVVKVGKVGARGEQLNAFQVVCSFEKDVKGKPINIVHVGQDGRARIMEYWRKRDIAKMISSDRIREEEELAELVDVPLPGIPSYSPQ